MVTNSHIVKHEDAQKAVDAYVSQVFGTGYQTQSGKHHKDSWRFLIVYHHDDMPRAVAVGRISVNAVTGQVEPLNDEHIYDMQEAGAVQIAQERGEFARNSEGYILRAHARIKANAWTSNHIDLKVGVRGGIFLPLETPVWRFTIHDFISDCDHTALDVIDVDAQTGQVYSFTLDKLIFLQEAVSAARKHQKLAAAA